MDGSVRSQKRALQVIFANLSGGSLDRRFFLVGGLLAALLYAPYDMCGAKFLWPLDHAKMSFHSIHSWQSCSSACRMSWIRLSACLKDFSVRVMLIYIFSLDDWWLAAS